MGEGVWELRKGEKKCRKKKKRETAKNVRHRVVIGLGWTVSVLVWWVGTL